LLQAKTKVDNANLDVVRGRPLLDRRVISEKTFDDRENLVRDAGIRPSRDFHSLQIAACTEALDCRQQNRAVPGRARADKCAVDVPKEETLFFHC
jgi:hypothetical protein